MEHSDLLLSSMRLLDRETQGEHCLAYLHALIQATNWQTERTDPMTIQIVLTQTSK